MSRKDQRLILDHITEYKLGEQPTERRSHVELVKTWDRCDAKSLISPFFAWKATRILEDTVAAGKCEGVWPINGHRVQRRIGNTYHDLFPVGAELSEARQEIFDVARKKQAPSLFSCNVTERSDSNSAFEFH